MFKVICIDDTCRPDGIPLSKWIKKDNMYTVIDIKKMNLQGGMLGYKLEEIDLDSCFPYQYFSAKRFAIILKQDNKWAEETLEKVLETAKEEFLV